MSDRIGTGQAMSIWFLLTFLPALVLAGPPVTLEEGSTPGHPQQPHVVVDGDGAIHVVYGAGQQVRYRSSRDGGKTFSAAVNLPAAGAISLGMRRGPRIAVGKDAICATVIGGVQGKGKDGDVLAFRSEDQGRTWTGPVLVNDVQDSAREGLHAMAAGPDGELCCVWLDLRHRKTEVMASRSMDDGRTWSPNVLVYRSPDGSVCECCHPSVALDDRGHLHVLWRNSLAGKRDMYTSVSSDGGATFGPAAKLGSGTWPLDACPMDGGAIAVADRSVATVWRRGAEVFLVEGQQPERRLGLFAAWLTKRGESLLLLKPGAKQPIPLAPHAADPVIAAAPQGRGPLVAAWEVRQGKQRSIQCQVVQE
jgi:hypothetical protein